MSTMLRYIVECCSMWGFSHRYDGKSLYIYKKDIDSAIIISDEKNIPKEIQQMLYF